MSKELQTLELNQEPYPSEIDEAVDMELAAAMEKRNLKKKIELPRRKAWSRAIRLFNHVL